MTTTVLPIAILSVDTLWLISCAMTTKKTVVYKSIKFLASGGVVWLCAEYLEGITVAHYTAALITAIVLALVNLLVRPILALVTLPITLLSFGLFSLVLTAFMVEITDYFVSGLHIDSFWWALLLGILVSAANSVLDYLIKKPKKIGNATKYTAYEEIQ